MSYVRVSQTIRAAYQATFQKDPPASEIHRVYGCILKRRDVPLWLTKWASENRVSAPAGEICRLLYL